MQSAPEETNIEAWQEIGPLLDEAMGGLGEADRNAVVLRFFQNKTAAEAAAEMKLTEAAAHKRVSRALEKLRKFFAHRGVSSTAAMIAGAISVNSIHAAPVALVKTVTLVAVAKGAAASTSTLTLIEGALKIMAWTKIKTAVVVVAGVILAAGTATMAIKSTHSAQERAQSIKAAGLFKNFVAENKAEVMAAATAAGKPMPPDYAAFFAAAETGDLPKMKDLWNSLGNSGPVESQEAARVTLFAYEMFTQWDEKYALAYGHDIMESILPGSLYFTGVSMGGNLLPAMEKSQAKGDPCFSLALGQLCEPGYRSYLQKLFGNNVHLPTDADAEKCFRDYAPDTLARFQTGKLPRNDIQHVDMLIAKAVFDQNPDRESYCEELLPVEWMYPHLEPHGLILKINRQTLSALPEDLVAQDRDYWLKQTRPMIGDWLTDDTSVKELVAWTERVRLNHDFSGFTGDRHFIENLGGQQQIYSKLRTAIGGVYAWRADHAANPAERERMTREADFVFRQALALWPCSQESCSPVVRYMTLLKKEHREADAQMVRNMALQCAKKLK